MVRTNLFIYWLHLSLFDWLFPEVDHSNISGLISTYCYLKLQSFYNGAEFKYSDEGNKLEKILRAMVSSM